MTSLSDDGRAYLNIGHEVKPDDPWDWHQWWTAGRFIRADVRGRPNPRMNHDDWLIFTCNNTECAAQMWVRVKDLGEVYFPAPPNRLEG